MARHSEFGHAKVDRYRDTVRVGKNFFRQWALDIALLDLSTNDVSRVLVSDSWPAWLGLQVAPMIVSTHTLRLWATPVCLSSRLAIGINIP